MCHINMIKPYYAASQNEKGERAETSPSTVCSVGSIGLSHRDDLKVTIPEGRLGNSDILKNLDEYLVHLGPEERSDVFLLIEFQSILSDVPSETNVLEHDIDVGEAQPIKQHAYSVNPEKCTLLKREVDYMI